MTQRIATGIPGLDEILMGGIPANTITVLMGAPGSGKTVLAEQIAFHNASLETPVLYLTTLAEPLDKFIVHGEKYAFFDAAKVGVSVFYEDLGYILRETGIESLADRITDLLIKYRPKLLFVDSFKALNELLVSEMQRRTVIYDFATALSAYQCTSFLIGEYAQEMVTSLAEFAIADVVLNLMRYTTNVREQRFLRVEKIRGSDSLQGLHAFSISADGIEIFPRILTPRVAPSYRPKVERVTTGVKGLDDMVAEGFWRGSTTMIAGPSGSGKTIMSLHFIRQGATNDEPSLYLGFQENPTQLARVMLNLGWDSEALLSSENLELMYRSPVEMQLDQVAAELFGRIRAGKVKRVVIDSLDDLERSSVDPQRFADFIYALMQWFAVENVTCMTTVEVADWFKGPGGTVTQQHVSNMCDNLVVLGFDIKGDADLRRSVRILKTRGSSHDEREHTLEISGRGAIVKKAK
ncbi:MAG TPA: ATPase domain-containing protein [Pyrinomonadaceae bacterium]|nr:ATPase domain-containing protein [Pyrinomonadaceae bacterium]